LVRIEGHELHAFCRQTIQTRSRHATVFTAAVHSGIAVTEIVGQNENDIRLLSWRLRLSGT
jgi:hypothetical protein